MSKIAKRMFFNKEAETTSQDELASLQAKQLRKIAQYVYDNNPVQRSRFKKLGVNPKDIKKVEDVVKLPLMDKNDLRDNYPMSLCCVDPKTVVEMHMSSGSTGTPIVMPYTQGDLDQWAECMARCLVMAGARKGDVVQITPSFGLFNGGFGFYHGARMAGMFVIPAGRAIRLG